MKNYSEFCYDFLLGDHFAKVSHEALIYYIALNFNSNNGFVANPLRVLDSFNFPKSVFDELVANKEILKTEDRSEIFITAYYVHNPGFNPSSWLNSPFAVYWKGKLSTKANRIATFNPDGVYTYKPKAEKEQEKNDPLSVIKEPENIDDSIKWTLENIKRATKLVEREQKNEVLTDEEKHLLEQWKIISGETVNPSSKDKKQKPNKYNK